LHDAGHDRKGAVIVVDDRRAQRLVQMGYAEVVPTPAPSKRKRAEE
jgi:hypothetical protein